MTSCENCTTDCLLRMVRDGSDPQRLLLDHRSPLNPEVGIYSFVGDDGLDRVQILSKQDVGYSISCRTLDDEGNELGYHILNCDSSDPITPEGKPIQQAILNLFAERVKENGFDAKLTLTDLVENDINASNSGVAKVVNGRSDTPNTGAECLRIEQRNEHIKIGFAASLLASRTPQNDLLTKCPSCYYSGKCAIQQQIQRRALPDAPNVNLGKQNGYIPIETLVGKSEQGDRQSFIITDYLIDLLSLQLQQAFDRLLANDSPIFIGSTALANALIPRFPRYVKDIDLNIQNPGILVQIQDVVNVAVANTMTQLKRLHGSNLQTRLVFFPNPQASDHRKYNGVLRAFDVQRGVSTSFGIQFMRIVPGTIRTTRAQYLHKYPDFKATPDDTLLVRHPHDELAMKLLAFVIRYSRDTADNNSRVKDLFDASTITRLFPCSPQQLQDILMADSSPAVNLQINSRLASAINRALQDTIKHPEILIESISRNRDFRKGYRRGTFKTGFDNEAKEVVERCIPYFEIIREFMAT